MGDDTDKDKRLSQNRMACKDCILASLVEEEAHKQHCNTPLSKYGLVIDPILAMVPRGDNGAAAVEGVKIWQWRWR
jgi:hypothetical protein